MGATGRNEPCPCGSGKKHKRCCLGRRETVSQQRKGMMVPAIVALAGFVGAYFAYGYQGVGTGIAVAIGGLVLAMAIFVLRDPPPPKQGGADAAAINFGK